MENRPIVVHPRIKPQEEEEEEEEAKPSGPAKPKYIASGGWSCMCLKPEPGLRGMYGASCRSSPAKPAPNRCRSGPAKQAPNCCRQIGCQARSLLWGAARGSLPALPSHRLPCPRRMSSQCQCCGIGGAGFCKASKGLQLAV